MHGPNAFLFQWSKLLAGLHLRLFQLQLWFACVVWQMTRAVMWSLLRLGRDNLIRLQQPTVVTRGGWLQYACLLNLPRSSPQTAVKTMQVLRLVRSHDESAAGRAHPGFQALEHGLRNLTVDGSKGVISYEKRGPPKKRSGERQALLLTTGQCHTVFSYHRLVASSHSFQVLPQLSAVNTPFVSLLIKRLAHDDILANGAR
mmetsp:Transcript_15951/g.43757  ORF Transcript_15951/g.43757 Transcript_15951/m.43757 type:complete len:201 (+) Transcript_15951:1955-2557(+)